MDYFLAILFGTFVGIWLSLKVGKMLWENEKQNAEANAVSAANQAKYEMLQEYIIQEKREKMRAFDMFFQVAEIAAKNVQNTQYYPKPLPSLGLSAEIQHLNAVYTPNTEPILQNVEVGEGAKDSNLVLKKGVSEWLRKGGARLFEGKRNIIIEMQGLKYTCDYTEEKGKTVKVSTLPLHLGKCLLPDCDANFISQEQSSKFCCDQHKNQHNNNK